MHLFAHRMFLIYGFRDSFPFRKCTVVTRMPKNFEQLFIPMHAIPGDYSVSMKTIHFTKVFKLV